MQILKDVHQEVELRSVNLDRVGITNLDWPLMIHNGGEFKEKINAKVSLSISLNKEARAAHMSRLVELLNFFSKRPIDFKSLKLFLERVKKITKSDSVFFEINFPYFKLKSSPVTNHFSYLYYQCKLKSSLINDIFLATLKVKVPVLTLCPCSLAISEIGAHNQRSQIEVEVVVKNKEWLDDLIKLVEGCGSHELFSLLKRPDEKAVIDKAMTQPRFVEDVVREVVLILSKNKYQYTKIKCKSFESIHNHNAFAEINLEK